MHWFLHIVWLPLLVMYEAGTAIPQPDAPSDSTPAPKIVYVVFKSFSYDQFVFGKDFSETRLDAQDIRKIEKVLVRFYQKEKKSTAFRNKSINNYFYQFIPGKTKEGERQVLLQWICRTQAQRFRWRKDRLRVRDADACFGEFLISLDKSIVVGYGINGSG